MYHNHSLVRRVCERDVTEHSHLLFLAVLICIHRLCFPFLPPEKLFLFSNLFPCTVRSRDRIAGALCFGLNSPVFESRWTKPIFFCLLNAETGRIMGPTLLPVLWVPSLFPEVKRPECEVDHSPSSSTEVKNAWNCFCTPL